METDRSIGEGPPCLRRHMRHNDFNSVKRVFKEAMTDVVRNVGRHEPEELGEAALPAYSHRNPLVDHIFWSRLKIAADALPSSRRLTVLDFGCGSGVMSYLLARAGHDVIAVDVDFAPLAQVQKRIGFPPNIAFHNKELADLALADSSVDAIVALDVLEHIRDLDGYLSLFVRILKPGGRIIVSGPTENWLYRFGRRLAGKDFTGAYHETDVATIRSAFAKKLEVHTIARLIWPFTLFEIFSASKPN